MQQTSNGYLLCAGVAAIAGGVVHIIAIFVGPSWYRLIGAPDSMVQLVVAGHPYPAIVCVVVASILFVWAAYAFSGAGVIRSLPLLRTGLVVIAALLIIRGVAFIPLMLWRPSLFVGICNCKGVDAFLIATSAICLAVGICYAVGSYKAWSQQ